jgi:hypothetical protein
MTRGLIKLFFITLLLPACNLLPDPADADPSLNASLEPNPVLSGTIENWEVGKTSLLKFRFVKKNLVGSALFDNSNTFGEFNVEKNGAFTAPLPNSAELEWLLEDASTTFSSLPCYGSSIQVTPEHVSIALAYLDLYWDSLTPTQTQLFAANNNAMQHFDLAGAPVGSKFSVYAFVDKDARVNANCGLLIAGAYHVNLNLKKGWNLVTLEIVSKGLFNYTDYRISTNGVPEGLKWFLFGKTSNTPTAPPLELPRPLPPAPIVPRANR